MCGLFIAVDPLLRIANEVLEKYRTDPLSFWPHFGSVSGTQYVRACIDLWARAWFAVCGPNIPFVNKKTTVPSY